MDPNDTNAIVESTGIVIVGAGIAGLAAALTLEQSNFKDYILVEAQSRIGGRIYSTPWRDGWLEQGAQFLHGNGSTLAQIAVEKYLSSDIPAAEGEGLYLREDGSEMDPNLVLEVDDVVKNIMEDCEKYAMNNEIEYIDLEENVDKVLRNRFHKYLKLTDDPLDIQNAKRELFEWFVRFLVIDNSCTTLDELSVKSWGKFKAVNGPQHIIFNSHYGSIVESIAGDLTQDNIRLNCPVIKIEWKEQVNLHLSKPIVLTLHNNKKIHANCVIVTSSLGYLKENCNRLFSPELPMHLSLAIQSMGFSTINKIFLDFEEPWWEPHVKGFQFLWRTENDEYNDIARDKLPSWLHDLTGFDVLKNHSSTLLGWIGGKGALTVETLNEEQIIQDCAKLFRFFLKNDSIPIASKCLRSCWATNQFVRGGYSHITRKCDVSGVSPATLAKPVWGTITSNDKNKSLPILMLAGEATHENFYSTTHGAYDTGVKQAQIFLDYHITN